MTSAEIDLLEKMLEQLERHIVQARLPKTHLHNVNDLRRKTIDVVFPDHLRFNHKKKSQQKEIQDYERPRGV